MISDPLIVVSECGEIKHVNGAMQDLLRLSDRMLANRSLNHYLSDETFSTLINVGMPAARTQVYRAPVELVDSRHQTHRTEARMVQLTDCAEFGDCYALMLEQPPVSVRSAFMGTGLETPHKVRVRAHGTGLIIRFDTNGIIGSVSEDAKILLGCGQCTLAGRVVWELNGWSDASQFEKEINSCMQALAHSEKQYMPARYDCESGDTVWLELCVTREQEQFVIEGYDVTSRVVSELSQKHYTTRLAQLSRQLIRAQESERRRIAQELHDQIGQLLTALRLGLHSVKHNVQTEEMKSRIDVSMETVDRVLSHVRSLSLDLRPAMLDDLGLGAALNWFGSRHAELTGLRIEVFTEHLERRLPDTVEVACFRIVQEAVANALRHSQSEEIHITMKSEDGLLVLQVEDFGIGFDTDEAWQGMPGKHNVGLENMQQRVALVGGEFHIDSKPGRGSRVRVRIPLH